MPSRISPLAITAFTVTCAAGRGRDAFACALQSRTSGLRENDLPEWLLPCQVGRVSGIENAPLPAAWAEWESRNHRLAWMALNEDGFRERALAAIERGRKTDEGHQLEYLYAMYEERLHAYQKDPPPPDWNGAFQLLKK